MRTFIFILIIFTLLSCIKKTVNQKIDKLYFLSSCSSDTSFIDKPLFDTTKLTVIAREEFDDSKDRRFNGHVIKLSNEPAPTDGGVVYYLTPDLGIIYSKSTTWPCYKCLHSTNDSIEKRINEYLEHILSKPNFIMDGEAPSFKGNIKFIPPSVYGK